MKTSNKFTHALLYILLCVMVFPNIASASTNDISDELAAMKRAREYEYLNPPHGLRVRGIEKTIPVAPVEPEIKKFVKTKAIFSYYNPYDPKQSPGHGITASGHYATMPTPSAPIPMFVAAAWESSEYFGKVYYVEALNAYLYIIDTGGLPLAQNKQVDIAAAGRWIKIVLPHTSWRGHMNPQVMMQVHDFKESCNKGRRCLPKPAVVKNMIQDGIIGITKKF